MDSQVGHLKLRMGPESPIFPLAVSKEVKVNTMMMPRSSQRNATTGFSLIEVLVALFVISVGIMGVMAALVWGVQHSDSGKVMTEASSVARSLTETIRLRGYLKRPFPAWATEDSEARSEITDFPFNSPDDEVYLSVVTGPSASNTQSDLARFQRNISVAELEPGGTSHLASMVRLSVKVYWQEQALERHVVVETLVPVIEET